MTTLTLLAPSAGCLWHQQEKLPDLVAPLPLDRPPTPEPTELPPDKAADACLATARALERQGHPAEAIAQYERARQFNPKLIQVSRRLAVLYDQVGAFDLALGEYKKALQHAPRDAALLNDVGYCHYQRGDLAEAEQWLRKAIAQDPKHTQAWINLGLVLGQQRRYDESREAFGKVLSPAEAHSNLGVILAQHGELAEAKAACRQALALNPHLPQARIVLARLEKE
ncbi:MAG: tetratricopeptide repeat protein [Gemmataceae bacterium]